MTPGYTICMYIRLSREDEEMTYKNESGSITAQRMLIKKYISDHDEFRNCSVIERCDDGLSGRYFDTRPGFTEMIDLAKTGKVKCIIVKDFSRFGRDYVELGDYLEQLFPFLGVRFISINDRYDSDKQDASLDVVFRNYIYDIYSRDLSKKALLTHRKAAEKGQYWSPQTVYGYVKKKDDKHKLEIDPEAAKVVREIFDRMLAGTKPTAIARDLNERGILTPLAYIHSKGRHTIRKDGFETLYWDAKTIADIVHNETYTGAVVSLKSVVDRQTGRQHKKDRSQWVVVPGMHEAIVSNEEFRTIQGMIGKRTMSPMKKTTPLYCGICGKKLKRTKEGKRYCQRGNLVKECECKEVVVNDEAVGKMVLQELKDKLHRVMETEDLKLQTTGRKPTDTAALESTLETVRLEKQQLYEKLLDRTIDRETFKTKKLTLEDKITAIEQQISDARLSETLQTDAVRDSKEKIKTAKTFLDIKEMTPEAWSTFIDEVLIFPEKRIEIHWTFEKET